MGYGKSQQKYIQKGLMAHNKKTKQCHECDLVSSLGTSEYLMWLSSSRLSVICICWCRQSFCHGSAVVLLRFLHVADRRTLVVAFAGGRCSFFSLRFVPDAAVGEHVFNGWIAAFSLRKSFVLDSLLKNGRFKIINQTSISKPPCHRARTSLVVTAPRSSSAKR